MALAQTLRFGTFNLNLIGNAEIAYDSNVDGLATLEEKEGFQRDDFYWLIGMRAGSEPVAMSPHTLLNLSAGFAHQNYFVRNDLDITTYNAMVNFQTRLRQLTLGGNAGVDYSIESMEHEYVPGGARRDPTLTHTANLYANWAYQKLRLQASWGFTRERHDLEEFWPGDNDETTLMAGAYFDVFTWGSLFYTWERTISTYILSGEEADDTIETVGLSGSVPVNLLRRPAIAYSLGFSRERTMEEDREDDSGWEFVHSVTIRDELDISKTTRLSASASWVNTISDDDDEVAFIYSVQLAQQVGPRAQHTLTFTQEPRPTFGSTSDTETTIYAYNLGIRDLLVKDLSVAFGISYQEDTPLGDPNAVTEKTTTLNLGLNHSRQLSRKLTRTLGYNYSWEDSNFSENGVTVQHLVRYGLVYHF